MTLTNEPGAARRDPRPGHMSIIFAAHAAVLLIAAASLVLPNSQASAHRLSYSYARNDNLVVNFIPNANYSHNDGGGLIQIKQLLTGYYQVTFLGTDAISPFPDHVQVTAFGSTTNTCQLQNWSAESAFVRCFDLSGTLASTEFSVLFIKREYHTAGLAYALADDPSEPTPYAPNTIYSFNPTGGGVLVTRTAVGSYTVDFPGMGAVGVNEGVPLVTAQASIPTRCSVSYWNAGSVMVRCRDFAGDLVDSRFNVMLQKPEAGQDGLAYAWMGSFATPGTPHTSYSYNATGGTIDSFRLGVGHFTIGFDSFTDVGFDVGNVQVTAYTAGSNYCNVDPWSTTAAFVRCYDVSGAPADTLFNVLYWKEPKRPFNQEYAFAWATQASAVSSYMPNDTQSYVAIGGDITISRSSTGTYSVSWPSMISVGSDSGTVLVTMQDPSTGHCTVSSWTETVVDITCFDVSGAPADRKFNVLHLKPTDGTPGIAYARAAMPTNPSYAAPAAYSHNPSGGAIQVTRSGTGVYQVGFAGYGAEPSVASHVQVSAYDSNSRCILDAWSDDDVYVNCYDVFGTPVDSGFSVAYLRLDEKYDGIAFAWADLSTTFSYPPFTPYKYNSGNDSIQLGRAATGDYAATFHGFDGMGIEDEFGIVMLSVYAEAGHSCRVSLTWPATTYSWCIDTADRLADTRYTVLYLRPTYAPEPTGLHVWAFGFTALALLERRRRSRRP